MEDAKRTSCRYLGLESVEIFKYNDFSDKLIAREGEKRQLGRSVMLRR